MPLYDYKCQNCNTTLTLFQSMSEIKTPEKTKKCESCGDFKLKHVILKTGGFTDPVSLGRVKPSDGFNEVMRNIRDGNPNSTVRVRD